jgi:hypothetical protein
MILFRVTFFVAVAVEAEATVDGVDVAGEVSPDISDIM